MREILSRLGRREDPLELGEELQQLLLYTKFRYWQYEEELRVFVPLEEVIKEGRLHFCLFDQSLRLAEVILGPQCSLSLDAVRQLTRALHPDVSTFKARLAFKFFKVVPYEKTVP